MASDYVIGVDQGTSGTKALLLDRGGVVLAAAERPMETRHPRAGWVEQDPNDMLHNVLSCVSELLERGGIESGQIAGIGLDNHTESLVLWDAASGEPVHPAIIWQCRRSTPQSDQLDTSDNRQAIRARTGLDLDPTFTATKLLWAFQNRPDLADGLRAGKVLWGTVDCWLIWKLTSGACYVTESSNASRTMLFNIGELAWDDELIGLFGLDLPRLPEVRPSMGPFGTCHLDLLGAEIPITGALGDQQASLFGHGCLERGAFKSTYGTGAFVWMNAGHDYHPAKNAGYLQTVAWHLDQPTYALEGFVMYAGAILDWLAETLGLGASAAEIAGKAETAGNSGGVALVPAFQGLASPWWDPNVKAAFMGLDSSTQGGQLCHAALEAVCFQVRRVLEDMQSAEVNPRGTVRVDGGLTRSAYFLQMQADVLGMPLRHAGIEHLTPYGAALMAGLGAGLWRDLDALESLTESGEGFVPRGETSEDWAARYSNWCRAVDLCLAWSSNQAGA